MVSEQTPPWDLFANGLDHSMKFSAKEYEDEQVDGHVPQLALARHLQQVAVRAVVEDGGPNQVRAQDQVARQQWHLFQSRQC